MTEPGLNRLARLLHPTSIALFGGSWAANVIAQLQKSGYDGAIWPVHPERHEILGQPCFASIDELPSAPDASFVGVNREASVQIIRQLSASGAGGATCFASGFLESETESAGGSSLQTRLVEAAGNMPILGPNCYGFLNYLDNVILWPDQHGGIRVERGVAIITQSSNIAVNLTMQRRNLPVAFVITAGNQAQTGAFDIALALIEDPRVSTVGLYLEGIGDVRALEALARQALTRGKSVVVLKIGRSNSAQIATITHTASLAGRASASSALFRRLGLVEVRSLAVFIETLKLAHAVCRLRGPSVSSVSCSGGEASLIADLCHDTRLSFRAFSDSASRALKAGLGPLVTIANPLDYHTFIWGDVPKMTRVFSTVMADHFDLTLFLLDLPRADRCDPMGYECAIEAIIAGRAATGARVAVIASLPENLDEAVSTRFESAGILVLHGLEEAIGAIDAMLQLHACPWADPAPVLLVAPDGPGAESSSGSRDPAMAGQPVLLDERQSRAALASYGLAMPSSAVARTSEALCEAAAKLSFPVALKGLGVAHKSAAGAIILNLADPDALREAAMKMSTLATELLVEEMITDALFELLVGITRDATGTFQLTLGAGGVQTELWRDTASLLLPASRQAIEQALSSLRMAPLLAGYRGMPGANINTVIDAVLAVCHYAEDNAGHLMELDVNPLLIRTHDVVAVDALIRLHATRLSPTLS